MDYSKLSYEQLKAAKEEIEAVMQARREEALETFKQQAASMGFDLSFMAANMNGSRAKYRDEHGNEWTGKGRKPGWLVEALENGKQLTDFALT